MTEPPFFLEVTRASHGSCGITGTPRKRSVYEKVTRVLPGRFRLVFLCSLLWGMVAWGMDGVLFWALETVRYLSIV
jgi:hypothetical protein